MTKSFSTPAQGINTGSVPLSLTMATVSDLAPIEAFFLVGDSEDLQNMARCLFLGLKADPVVVKSMKNSEIAQLAVKQIELISAELGGRGMYVTKDFNKKMKQRNLKIVSEYTGSNVPALSRRYGVSDMRIHQILTDGRKKLASSKRESTS